MRKPQPHAISDATNRRQRRNLVDVGGGRVAPPPVTADAVASRRTLLRLTVLTAISILLALTIGAAPAAHAEPDSPASFATLGLTDVTPTTVTGSTGKTVTVRGKVVNTAGRPISDVSVSLRRAGAVHASYQLRSALTSPINEYGVVSRSQVVTGTLGVGKSADFSIEVPIDGPGGLGLRSAGVYPLLVDVTGSPRDVGTLSIAESRTMIPVLSLPADQGRARDYVDPATGAEGVPLLGRDGSIAPNTSSPSSFTMIWPLAASPQEAAGILGGDTADLRLISDSLGHSLQSDGRLGMALRALEELVGVNGDAAPPTSTPDAGPTDQPADPVRDSICLAVDPNLLVTVRHMASGYLVSNNPADPDSPTHEGQGAKAAASWIARLKQVAGRMCVTALPFAQVGLESLSSIGNDDLTDRALLRPYDTVDAVLGVKTVRGLTLPATGTLTDTARDLLSSRSIPAAAVASTALAPVPDDGPASGSETGRYTDHGVALQTYDVAVSAALGAAGLTPVVPAIMPNWQQPDLSDESAVSRRQTAAAALTFPMLTAPAPSADDEPSAHHLPTTGRSSFVMPPTYWSPTVDDARVLRETAALMLSSGTARPVPLATVLDEMPAAKAPGRLEVPGDVQADVAAGYPVTQHDAETIRQRLRAIDKMQSSLVGNNDTVTTPAEYLAPLRDDLLRAVSSASTTETSVTTGERNQRLTAVGKTLRSMQNAVSLLDPSGRYTLASERSPLLLVVRNTLALPIRVRLDIDAPHTLEIGDLGLFEIPAAGTRQLQIPTHATSSEPATVNISLVTSSDIPLSTPIELSVYANAYGKGLFWITIGAAIILILLTARRLWHRFRGKPDPADEDRPEPDDEHREQATLSYDARLAASARVGDEEPVDLVIERTDHDRPEGNDGERS
ncbi:hypothetical protein [Gordonia phthalatica]|uniref:hypothetical protein n=1 Tax=Gordonia phthalatica TaxID=1136941 RepID=UPI001D04791D|nr:hypothetical protein [Gordonia phthalatica]